MASTETRVSYSFILLVNGALFPNLTCESSVLRGFVSLHHLFESLVNFL